MSVIDYNTWNPVFEVQVLDGVLPSEIMIARTLEFTYIDRVKQFDDIEWKLDNRDGLLTRPEKLAAGLLIRFRVGYLGAMMPWRTMVINRARGGLGVYGRENPAVGEKEGTVTFAGRNRNAAGGKVPNPSWSNRAKAPRVSKSGKGPKIFGPTMSGSSDMVLGKKDKPRIVDAQTLYDGIAEIARRNGFEGPFVLLEDPEEDLESGRLVIPASRTDGQYLADEAASRGWMFKIDGDYFHFHSPSWPGGRFDVVDSLIYGSGPDITELTFDADLQLPLPRSIKTTSINPMTRQMVTYQAERSQLQGKAQIAIGYLKNMEHPAREAQTYQDLTFSSLALSQKQVTKQTIDAFIARHMRAFQLNVSCVGNPRLLAGRLVDISGVGSPFADGRWLIKEARHKIRAGSSLVYATDIHLGPPTKPATVSGKVTAGTTTDAGKNQRQGRTSVARIYYKGLEPRVGSVRKK